MASTTIAAAGDEQPRYKAGHDTVNLGQWITQFLTRSVNRKGYRVYYDHGDSKHENVAAIKGFFGETVANHNRIADVDIMIVKDDRIVLLIEVEERGSSPKKILGDVLAILMCNRFAVRKNGSQHYFAIAADTRIVVSGILPESGKRMAKMNEVLQPRLHELGGFVGGINPTNVDLLFRPTMDATKDALKAMINSRLPT